MGRRDSRLCALALGAGLLLGAPLRAAAADSDEDGLEDSVEQPFGDTDGDGIADTLDGDDDDDGLRTALELVPGIGPIDSDGDGTNDHRDPDDDDDAAPTSVERRFAPYADSNHNGIVAYLDAAEIGPAEADADGDGLSDSVDPDDDDDGVLDVDERAGDSDGDTLLDRFDDEDDGDGLLTRFEHTQATPPLDTDADGTPDYLDLDDDGDGLPTTAESPDPNGDHVPDDARRSVLMLRDYLNPDDDGDEVATKLERPGDVDLDTDADGKPNHRDQDDDGDQLDTTDETANGVDEDADGDGTPNYLDADDDGDQIDSKVECADLRRLDVDLDGIFNCLDLDSDDDTVDDRVEGVLDRDHDGVPDYLDGDTIPDDRDDDGIPDARECAPTTTPCPDTDGDGKADPDDADDDGDRVPTRTERGAKALDTDADGVPDSRDADDDADGVPSSDELALDAALLDTDRDGVPNHRDADDNGDGVLTRDQGAPSRDSDGDGTPDYLQIAAGTPEIVVDAGTDTPPPAVTPDSGAGGGEGGGGLQTVPRDSGGCALSASTRAADGGWLLSLLLLGLAARTRRRRSAHGRGLLALLSLSSGCSEEGATLPLDGSLLDAGFDGGRDASVAKDASSRDAASGCSSEPLSMTVANSPGRSFAAAITGNRVHVVYLIAGCGAASSATSARGLRAISFATAGAASEPIDLANTDPSRCVVTRDPAIAVHAQAGASVFFGTDASGSYTLQHGVLSDAPSFRALTLPSGVALAGVATLFGTQPTLGYRFVESLGSDDGKAAAIAVSQPDKIQAQVVAATADHRPVQLAVADLGGSGGNRGVVAWVSDRAATRGSYYRRVDAFGVGSGDIVALGGETGPYSSVDVAARDEGGGAIVYSVLAAGGRHVLRFRPLAADGSSGTDVALTEADQDISEFAATSYTNGYAIAFRRRPNAETASPGGVNLLLIDPQGRVGASRFVGDAAATQGLELLVASDGRLVMLYTDVPPAPADVGDLRLRVDRLTCL